MSYNKLLLDPKWRRKRLKILKRDHYKCTVCGSRKGLVIHHTFYFDNHVKPWEYPNESLMTLCGKCHYKYHIFCEVEIKPKVDQNGKRKKKKGVSLSYLQKINGLRIKKRDGSIILIS